MKQVPPVQLVGKPIKTIVQADEVFIIACGEEYSVLGIEPGWYGDPGSIEEKPDWNWREAHIAAIEAGIVTQAEADADKEVRKAAWEREQDEAARRQYEELRKRFEK